MAGRGCHEVSQLNPKLNLLAQLNPKLNLVAQEQDTMEEEEGEEKVFLTCLFNDDVHDMVTVQKSIQESAEVISPKP